MEHTQLGGDSRDPVLALPDPKETNRLTSSLWPISVGISFAVLVFSLALVFIFGIQNLIQSSVPPTEREKTNSGLPVRLMVPTIAVDAPMEYVGLASDGVVGAPENPDNVAWFALGPLPGEEGSAVIAGHYGWTGGKAAAFDDLSKLRIGDKLYVENDKGETIPFIVREIRSYNPQADASDVFSSHDGKAHLNLITCEGVWSSTSKDYSKRLVVFTTRE